MQMMLRVAAAVCLLLLSTVSRGEADSDAPCNKFSVSVDKCQPAGHAGAGCDYIVACTSWGKSPTAEFKKVLDDFRSSVRLDLNRSFSNQLDLIDDRLDFIARAIVDSDRADDLENELIELEQLKATVADLLKIIPPSVEESQED